MKNMYFGDIGDYGKYGLLKVLLDQGLSIGVNWYFTEDESNVNDGKFIDYLSDDKKNEIYRECDPALYDFLKSSLKSHKRSINLIENYTEFKNISFYSELLEIDHITGLSQRGRDERVKLRKDWFEKSIHTLRGCDMIFCDPDNGIMPKSVSLTKSKSIKYVDPCEIRDYFKRGYSLMIYNHRDRSKEDQYINRLKEVADGLDGCTVAGIRFTRFNVRDYIFIMQPQHTEKISIGIEEVLKSDWRNLFKHLFIM